MRIRTEGEYEYLKGKRDGIKLALDIITRRDAHPQSIRWLVTERDNLTQSLNLSKRADGRPYTEGEIE